MARIRVLHLIEGLGPGGAERLLFTNLSHLDQSRFDNVVCHLSDASLHWQEPIKGLGTPVIPLGIRGRYDIWRGVVKLLSVLSQYRPDLIHTHLYTANVCGRLAGRLRGIPVVSSLHNPDYDAAVFEDNISLKSWKLRLLQGVDRLSSKLGEVRFIAVSEFVRQSGIRHLGIDPGQIVVVYNSVDLDSFGPQPIETVERLRGHLGLDGLGPVLLCVGRLDPQKGQKYVVRALQTVKREFPSAQLLLVGTLPPHAEGRLREEAQACGVGDSVHFVGVRRDVPALLQLSDLFVFPSVFEGLGIALIEAMAMERACVASGVGAIPELVADKESGVLVRPMDPAALGEAIVRLLRDDSLRVRMGRAGRRIVEERFNVDRNIRTLQDLYQRIVAKDWVVGST